MVNLTQQQEAKVAEMLDAGWFYNVITYVKATANVSYQEAFKWVEERAW
jgi:hypothetical protein